MLDRHGHRHGAGGGPVVLTKRVNESVPTGVAQYDDDLAFHMSPGGIYAFEAMLIVRAQTTGNFTYEWIEPDGTFDIQARTDTAVVSLTEATGSSLVAMTAGVARIIHFVGTIVAGAAGGMFRLQWS